MSSNEEIIKREYVMYGHSKPDLHGEACGNCIEAETLIKTEIIPKETIPSEFREVDVYSDEGQKYTNEKKIDKMPHIEKCDILKTGEKKCDTYIPKKGDKK